MTKIILPLPELQPKASPVAIWAAMIAVYIVWGSTYLAIRFAVETLPPFLMASTRFLLAGGLLLLVRRAMGDPLPTRSEWRGAAVLGLFLLLGGNGGISWAEQYVPSGLTALLVASSPLWMLLMEAFLPGGQRPTRRAVAGVILGFGGILLLFWPGQGSLLNVHLAGALAVLFATLSWAFGSIYSRNLRLPASPMMGTAAEMLSGGLALGALSLVTGDYARLDLDRSVDQLAAGRFIPDRVRRDRGLFGLHLAAAGRPHLAGLDVCLRQPAGGADAGGGDRQ
jgi:drug/metabolite transporter (DMT)-like permease